MTDSAAQVDVGTAPSGAVSVPHVVPKWAAVVGDRLIQLPHQRVKVREVLAQAGLPHDTPLIRDYDSPNDVVLAKDADIDLAEGNVFRTERQGTPGDGSTPDAPPKLAFVVDDEWEVTIRPDQTGQMLRDLFEIPDGAELLRDYKSPQDAVVADEDSVLFADGPVFRTRVGTVTVKVNNNEVCVPLRGTAVSLKQAAIDQKVAIRIDFLLFAVRQDGSLSPAIPDDRMLAFHEGEEFRCVAPDDNSSTSVMTPAVEQAIAEIQATFPGHQVDVEPDSDGGAYVTVRDLPLGDQYTPSVSWVGLHVTFQYPHPALNQLFCVAGLKKNGADVTAPFHKGEWTPPSGKVAATMISRKSPGWDAAVDTAAIKLLKVLEWANEHLHLPHR